MKIFFTILAFLGGFLSVSQALSMTSDNIFNNRAPQSTHNYEMKRIYIPSLKCSVDKMEIDMTNLDYHAKECFAIGPQHIKMTMPSI
jgi:hypothetical protein